MKKLKIQISGEFLQTQQLTKFVDDTIFLTKIYFKAIKIAIYLKGRKFRGILYFVDQ